MSYPLGAKHDSKATQNQNPDYRLCDMCGEEMDRYDDDYEKEVTFNCSSCEHTFTI